MSAGRSDYRRKFIKMTKKKGEFEQIGEDCDFEDPLARWWTMLPPSEAEDPEETWQKMLAEYGWVDQQGWWVGPQWIENSKWMKGDEILVALRSDPASMENLQGDPQPISKLANEIVCDHPGSWYTGEEHSQRETGTRRKNILMYKMRCFVDKSFKALKACQVGPNFQHPIVCFGRSGGDVLDPVGTAFGLLCGVSGVRTQIEPFVDQCMTSQIQVDLCQCGRARRFLNSFTSSTQSLTHSRYLFEPLSNYSKFFNSCNITISL